MPFGERAHAHAEITRGPDQPDQVLRVFQALRMPDPLGVGVARGVTAQRQHVAHADGRVRADHAPQFGHGVVHRREVPHRGERRLRGDPAGHPDGPVPGRTARPVGDRDERGMQRLQLPDRPPQPPLGVLGLGRHELERVRLTARGQQVTDGWRTVQDPGWHVPRLVGSRPDAARRAWPGPRPERSGFNQAAGSDPGAPTGDAGRVGRTASGASEREGLRPPVHLGAGDSRSSPGSACREACRRP